MNIHTAEFGQEFDTFMTSEIPPVDETGFDYDRNIPGDRVEADCIHQNGERSEHFPMFGGVFEPYATWDCFDCGEEIRL